MTDLPTGTVTLLFTDIEGSTRLLQLCGDRYTDVIAEHHRLLRAAFVERGGHEVDTAGDSFFVVFPRARDAILAAVAAQQAVVAHPWPPGAAVRVRMGIHTGEPQRVDAGYRGIDVHRAARICQAAYGGQILLSQTTRDLVGDELPQGTGVRDLGPHRLKDLDGRQYLFQVAAAGLRSDFPVLKSLDAVPNNLPLQLTSFIGRERELTEVRQRLASARLLTLTGAGGCGKTRLALQVAADLLPQYPDGVWLVELAALSDPALVPQAVASALGLAEQPGRSLVEALVDYLRPRSLLVVLDNCEHLLSACAQLADRLLRTCPSLHILATSRAALRIAGEISWRVPSMSVPDPADLLAPDRLSGYEAVQLLVERAMAVLPDFRVTPENASAIAGMCHRLDGMPLAIELAAARVKVLGVEQIAARLDDRFRLLTGGSTIALPRQQTLRATMDWSYDLLSDDERRVCRRLSVFAGGWTVEAAEAVCAGDGVAVSDILDLLAQLVDKSLVIADTLDGGVRNRFLETVRQYSQGQLNELRETAGVRQRHLDYFLSLAEGAEPRVRGPEQAAWLSRLEVEHDNLRAALAWSAESGDPQRLLRLSHALWWFWYVRGYHREGRHWLEEALRVSEGASAVLRAKVHNGAGYLAADQGDYVAAPAHFEASLAIHRTLTDSAGIADSFHGLGRVAWRRGDFERAVDFYEKALSFRDELGASFVIAWVLNSFVTLRMAKSELPEAAALIRESLSINKQIGNRRGVAVATGNLGTVALRLGNYAEAGPLLKEALALRWELGDKRGIVSELVEVGLLLSAQRQPVPAAHLLGAAEALGESIGAPLSASERAVADYDRYLAVLAADLSPSALKTAWADGRAMTLEQTLEYALGNTTS